MRSRTALIVLIVYFVWIAYIIQTVIGAFAEVVVSPCNPICFPNSYDENNPDCICNHKE